jgi:hypothetical protein
MRSAILSDEVITLLACPLDIELPESALGWFPDDSMDLELSRFVAATNKTSVPKGTHFLNLSAGYPEGLARIESNAFVSGVAHLEHSPARHSLAIYSLKRLLESHANRKLVALLLGPLTFDLNCLPDFFDQMGNPFGMLSDNRDVILFNGNKPDADLAIALAMDLVVSGAIYGISPYRLDTFLDAVQMAVGSVSELAPSKLIGTLVE